MARRKIKLGDKRAIVVGGVFGGITGSEFGPVGVGVGVGVGMKAGSAISKIALDIKRSKKKKI
jgi:hypothetical protein